MSFKSCHLQVEVGDQESINNTFDTNICICGSSAFEVMINYYLRTLPPDENGDIFDGGTIECILKLNGGLVYLQKFYCFELKIQYFLILASGFSVSLVVVGIKNKLWFYCMFKKKKHFPPHVLWMS